MLKKRNMTVAQLGMLLVGGQRRTTYKCRLRARESLFEYQRQYQYCRAVGLLCRQHHLSKVAGSEVGRIQKDWEIPGRKSRDRTGRDVP